MKEKKAKKPKINQADARAYMKASAAVNVDNRFKRRRELAETEPIGKLLDEGNAETLMSIIETYTAPVVLSGWSSFRLHFARMNDREARWNVQGGVTIYRCGANFVVQSHEDPENRLRLSFDGKMVKRVRSAAPRVVELRGMRYSGVRLA